ncbi:hypothetical protein NC652_029098 [Populus alba x Populus x berolinensis]|nr:hypothetical protein NC652_029098 [Populus alba x Populus x berolinensis]
MKGVISVAFPLDVLSLIWLLFLDKINKVTACLYPMAGETCLTWNSLYHDEENIYLGIYYFTLSLSRNEITRESIYTIYNLKCPSGVKLRNSTLLHYLGIISCIRHVLGFVQLPSSAFMMKKSFGTVNFKRVNSLRRVNKSNSVVGTRMFDMLVL